MDEPKLHVAANIQDAPFSDREVRELAELLARCKTLGTSANQLLTGRDRHICLEMAFNVAADILSTLDTKVAQTRNRRRRTGSDGVRNLIRLHRDELERVEGFFATAARERARALYFWGMLLALPVLALLGWSAFSGLGAADVPRSRLIPLTGALAAGAMGAIVSVMFRMARGRFRVRYEAGTAYLLTMGLFRPVLGSVFGLVLGFGLVTGLFEFAVVAPDSVDFYVYALVGFFAGFSERVAPDMLSKQPLSAAASEGEDPEAT